MRRTTIVLAAVVTGVVGAAATHEGGNVSALTDAAGGVARPAAPPAARPPVTAKASHGKDTTGAVTESRAAVAVTGTGEAAFLIAVVKNLGARTVSKADVTSLEIWVSREGTWGQGARWNPLNSTLPKPGSTWFNTFTDAEGQTLHVVNYLNAAEGAQATAETLSKGYPQIVAYLLDGTGLCLNASPSSVLGEEFRTWSGDGYHELPGC